MAVIAKVAVQAAPYAIDKVYDYLLPQDMAAQVGAVCWSPLDGATDPARR